LADTINPRATTRLACLALGAALVAVDQATKLAALRSSFAQKPWEVIPGYFDLVLVHNTGAAWGFMRGNNWPLFGVAVVVFVVLLAAHRQVTEGWTERYYALAMILGGIVGNSIDRVWRGQVVDFLDFHLGPHHWPAFNVADSALCVGVGLVLLSSFLRKRRPPPAAEPGHE